MKKLLFCALGLSLAACSGNTVKQTLGIDNASPDEFRVVSRPPLSVPPQFDLRPPGIEGTAQPAARDKAQSLILGTESSEVTVKGGTQAETTFLKKAGASAADPNVKQELTEKKINEQLKKEDQSWWDRVTTLPGNKEPVVKAKDESERLKKNKEEGKPVTEGTTPETGGGPVNTLKHWMGDD